MTRVEVILILGDAPSERKGAAKLAEAQEAIIWRRESVVMALSLAKSHAGTSLQQFGFDQPWRRRRLQGMETILLGAVGITLLIVIFTANTCPKCKQRWATKKTGERKGRTSATDITLFESQGIGMEDVAVAAHIFAKAKSEGIGVELPF